MPTYTKVLAFGCIHVPHHDPEAIEWLCQKIAKLKPNVLIHLGDQLDSAAASRWDDREESTTPLEEEFRMTDTILRSIRKAAPRGARLVFLPGNHDDNLEAPARIHRLIRSLTSWRTPHPTTNGVVNVEIPEHWEIGAKHLYCRNRGVFRVGGQVAFAHGYECSTNSDESQSIKLGVPSGLFVSAHTHRPVPVSQAHKTKRIPLPYWYANVGCLRDMKPAYMARKDTTQWGQAALYAEVNPRGRSGGPREWDAQLHLFRMYNEIA